MVTGEFYGRVTIRWVTKVTTRVNPLRDKRPACRWLRSSSYNFPDQRDAVMKSLSKNFMFSGTRGGIENAIHERTHRPYVSTQRPDGRNLVCWKLLLIGKFCGCLPTSVAKVRVTPDPDTAAGAPDDPIPTAAPTEAPRAPARPKAPPVVRTNTTAPGPFGATGVGPRIRFRTARRPLPRPPVVAGCGGDPPRPGPRRAGRRPGVPAPPAAPCRCQRCAACATPGPRSPPSLPARAAAWCPACRAVTLGRIDSRPHQVVRRADPAAQLPDRCATDCSDTASSNIGEGSHHK